ncbi:MAG: signal peptidase I [Acidobacteria bacterium]|nr:signal peptidase I [Acidobacteriota bacterium]
MISREPGMRLMMRVIGLPGEVVELSDGEVLINGKKLIQEFDVTIERKNFGPITVEPNKYFLLGDNRPESLDSRQWKDPTIERSQIYSKVVQIKKGFYNGN